MSNEKKQTYIDRLGDTVGSTAQSLSRLENLLHDMEVKLQGNLPRPDSSGEPVEVIDISTLEGVSLMSYHQANRAYSIAEEFENLLSRL